MNDKTTHFIYSGSRKQGRLIEVDIQISNKRHGIYFRANNDVELTGNLESFLAIAILPCMKTGGGQLNAGGEVGQKFYSALSMIQDIYCEWDTSLHRTEIKTIMPVQKNQMSQNRVGAFFTGGVDSFYTLLKNKDEITDLIFVHGLDIKLKDTLLREKTSKTIHEVASHFGKNVIEIETNIREFLDAYVKWGLLGHGAALATTGHLLFQKFRRIYIASSFSFADLFPWGTHPALDHLWSSDSLEFIHDGCEATRVKKVSFISKHEIVLKNLRVCYENPESAYNCGRCEKCLRTMINLEVNNALSRCTTFDEELDPGRVSNIAVRGEARRVFIRENLDALEKCQGNDDLQNALRNILNKPVN